MEQKVKAGMAKMLEVKAQIERSIKTVTDLAEEQDELKNIIKRGMKGAKHNFQPVVDGLKEQVEGYKTQKESFLEIKENLDSLVEIYTKGHKEGATEQEKRDAIVAEATVNSVLISVKVLQTEAELKVEAERAKKAQEEAAKNAQKQVSETKEN